MRHAGGIDDEGDGVDGVETGRVVGNFSNWTALC